MEINHARLVDVDAVSVFMEFDPVQHTSTVNYVETVSAV